MQYRRNYVLNGWKEINASGKEQIETLDEVRLTFKLFCHHLHDFCQGDKLVPVPQQDVHEHNINFRNVLKTSFDAIEIFECIFLESAFEGRVCRRAGKIGWRWSARGRSREFIEVRSGIGPIQGSRYACRKSFWKVHCGGGIGCCGDKTKKERWRSCRFANATPRKMVRAWPVD